MPTLVRWRRVLFLGLACVVAALIALGHDWFFDQVASAGSNAVLYPYRRPVTAAPPPGCASSDFEGDGIVLRGWRCAAVGPRRGTLVVLHGIGDNRESTSGTIAHYVERGFDVIAYDSRAQGESEGSVCSYGVFESRDLRRVVDGVPPGPVVLFGSSLGAAIALQSAASNPRISAVIAAETFSDLRAIATDRAPFVFTQSAIDRALALTEIAGGFRVADASAVRAASRITAPTLVIHGEGDVDTRPEHSRRVYAALAGPKELIIVPRAGHNESLRPEIRGRIDAFLDRVVPRLTDVSP